MPFALEQVPERLVVDRVVELHLGAFDEGSQLARRTVGDGLLQFRIAALHVGAQNLRNPRRGLEVVNRLLDVVRQVAAAGAQIVRVGDVAVDAGFEDAVERQVGVGVGCHGADFGAHRPVVADGYADHGAAIDGRSANLVGRLEMRVEPPIGVHAGIEDQAKVQRMGQDAVEEVPAKGGELLLALLVPEQVGFALETETLVCMPLPLTPTTGLGR